MENIWINVISILVGGGVFSFITALLTSRNNNKKVKAEADKIVAETEKIRIEYTKSMQEGFQSMIDELREENARLVTQLKQLQKESMEQSDKIDCLTERITQLELYIVNNGLPLPEASK